MISITPGSLAFGDKTYHMRFHITTSFQGETVNGHVEGYWFPSWEGDGIEKRSSYSVELQELLRRTKHDPVWETNFFSTVETTIHDTLEPLVIQREVEVLQQLQDSFSFHRVEWLEKEQQIHIYFHLHNEEKMMYVPYDSPVANCFTWVRFAETDEDWEKDPAMCTEDLLFDLFLEHIDTVPELRLSHLFQPFHRPSHPLYQQIKEKIKK